MATELNGKGRSHAKSLVDAGKVDRDSTWSFNAADENKILGDPPDWEAYSTWFLGHEAGEDDKTKAAWKYPFGKEGKVYRRALIAIESRAGQEGASEIAAAAKALLAGVDKEDDKKADDFMRGPRLPASAGTRHWFRIDVSAEDDTGAPQKAETADILVYDAIGSWFDGVSAKDFIAALAKLPEKVKSINLHVNSPGGDVFEAVAIANALKQHKATVNTLIEGIAASAATIVTQGGSDTVKIADNAMVMIHNPFALAIGDADDMRDAAEMLDRVGDVIVATYARRSKEDPKKLSKMMADETWMTADEAVEHGFADEKTDFKAQALATIDPRALEQLRVPAPLAARVAAMVRPPEAKKEEPPAPSPAVPAGAKDVMVACKNAGLDLAFATQICDSGVALPEAVARITAEVAARKQEETRRSEIRALCNTAGQSYLADTYIAGGMAVAEVRTQLQAITAKQDEVKINTAIVEGTKQKPLIDTNAVYAERNKLVRKEH